MVAWCNPGMLPGDRLHAVEAWKAEGAKVVHRNNSVQLADSGTQSTVTVNGDAPRVRTPAEIVGLEPAALIDHIAMVDWSLLDAIPGERGGSMRVTPSELQGILESVQRSSVEPPCSLAGGSVGNTIRGLAAGLGVNAALVGACGTDAGGRMFFDSMDRAGVDLSRLRLTNGSTGQCVCMVDERGNRTMRPCLADSVRLQADELELEDFVGAKWVVLNVYSFYSEGLVEHAAKLAKEAGARVSMDLASFEAVRRFRPQLLSLIKSGHVDVCFANEDEAREISRDGDKEGSPERGLEMLAKACGCAVVMLGSRGCVAQRGAEVVRVSALGPPSVVDTTGAGDLFASGFLFGFMRDLPLDQCCRLGCCTGATVVQSLGAEVPPSGWAWMRSQLLNQKLAAVTTLLAPLAPCTPP